MVKKTELVCIVDRSGSMQATKEAAQKGFNDFIKEQKSVDAPCKVTLIEFDAEINVVWPRQNLKDVGEYVLHPNAMTRLYDAIGQGINSVKLDTKRNVIILIVTDGGENSSRSWSLPAIKGLINDRQRRGWSIVYVGAGLDAYQAGQMVGINPDNIVRTSASKKSYSTTYGAVSHNVMASRNLGEKVGAFTSSQRSDAMVTDEEDI